MCLAQGPQRSEAGEARTRYPLGAQWLIGRVLDLRPRVRGFQPHRHHCVVSLSKNINPSLVLVKPRKTIPCITERLLMGRKESKQTNKQNHHINISRRNHTHAPSPATGCLYVKSNTHPMYYSSLIIDRKNQRTRLASPGLSL